MQKYCQTLKFLFFIRLWCNFAFLQLESHVGVIFQMFILCFVYSCLPGRWGCGRDLTDGKKKKPTWWFLAQCRNKFSLWAPACWMQTSCQTWLPVTAKKRGFCFVFILVFVFCGGRGRKWGRLEMKWSLLESTPAPGTVSGRERAPDNSFLCPYMSGVAEVWENEVKGNVH